MRAANPLDRPAHREGAQATGSAVNTAACGRIPVAIVGGGPVGLSLALALQKQGVLADIFDARDAQARRQDGRALALSYGSRQTLEWLGVWQSIEATPITADDCRCAVDMVIHGIGDCR